MHNQFKGNPASVPGQHGPGVESLARVLYAAHCGWGNIINVTPIGAWNGVMVGMACMFGMSKLVENFHTIFNRKEYMAYVEKLKADELIV